MGKISGKELYFITLQHCVGFLKEEIHNRYPSWSFKKGHHNFLTYETDKARTLEEVRDLPLIFKLSTGKLLGTGNLHDMEKRALEAQEEYDAVTIHRWDLVEEDGKMGDRKTKGDVIDIIRFSDDEFAVGIRYQIRGDFAPYKGSSPIPCPDIDMKHGHQKMAEAFKHYRPHVAHDEVFLDLGCAPGGGAYFLLDKGYRVIGVDINDVDPQLTDRFKEGFLQLKQEAAEINVKHLKGLPPIDWVVSDLDTNSRDILPFLSKLISKLDDCQGLIFHIRVDDSLNLEEVEHIEQTIRDAGLGLIRKGLLPSHGKEFCLFAKKED